MGVPYGHPFFGNQYTNGGYVPGSYTYMVDNGIETLKTVSNKIGKDVTRIATNQDSESIVSKVLVTKYSNKSVIMISGIILVVTAIGGLVTHKLCKKKAKAKQQSQQSIKLKNVGICTHCGEPLVDSTYVPESGKNSYDAHIICKKCGKKNYARYTEESSSFDKN